MSPYRERALQERATFTIFDAEVVKDLSEFFARAVVAGLFVALAVVVPAVVPLMALAILLAWLSQLG